MLSCVYKIFLPAYNSAKIIKKIDQDFPELWSQMYCHLFLVHSVFSTLLFCVVYAKYLCTTMTVKNKRTQKIECLLTSTVHTTTASDQKTAVTAGQFYYWRDACKVNQPLPDTRSLSQASVWVEWQVRTRMSGHEWSVSQNRNRITDVNKHATRASIPIGQYLEQGDTITNVPQYLTFSFLEWSLLNSVRVAVNRCFVTLSPLCLHSETHNCWLPFMQCIVCVYC